MAIPPKNGDLTTPDFPHNIFVYGYFKSGGLTDIA